MKIYFDDGAPTPAFTYLKGAPAPPAPEAPEPARQRRKLRSWQVAVVYAMIHTGLMTTIIMLATGDNFLGLLSLAFHGAMLFAGMGFGFAAGKL